MEISIPCGIGDMHGIMQKCNGGCYRQTRGFVIATGRQTSVRSFLELCAAELGWGGIDWEGQGVDEIGRRKDNGSVVVRIDPCYFRPAEVETLLGDPSKANSLLGWTPTTTLEQLVQEMIKADLSIASSRL